MEKEKNKKNNKSLTILLTIIIIILLGLIAYFTYNDYLKDKNSNNKENITTKTNYYSANYLTSNNFITEAYTYSLEKTICDENVKYGLYKDDNGYYIQYCTYENELKLSKIYPSTTTDKIYHNAYTTDEGGYLFYDILRLDSNNNLYYSFYGLSEEQYTNVKTFTDGKKYSDFKIENVKNVYRLTSDKSNRWYNAIAVLEMTDGKMKILMNKDKRIFKNEEGITIENLENIYPYFDYICAFNGPVCNETMFYITFDKKMVANYNINKPITNENGQEIKVKDAFATFDTKGLGASGASLFYPDYDEGYPSYEFTYTIYILSEDNNLYKIELDKNMINNKEEVKAKLYKENVSSIEVKYENSSTWANEYIINYTTGGNDSFKLGDMRSCTSTMSDRN